MKYFLVICVMGIGLAQENKNDFDPDKLKDPEPKWPMIISPLMPKIEKEKSENKTDTTQIIIEGFVCRFWPHALERMRINCGRH